MKKSDIFAMAWQNLRNRKTRTRLTIAGVVIGSAPCAAASSKISDLEEE